MQLGRKKDRKIGDRIRRWGKENIKAGLTAKRPPKRQKTDKCSAFSSADSQTFLWINISSSVVHHI